MLSVRFIPAAVSLVGVTVEVRPGSVVVLLEAYRCVGQWRPNRNPGCV